MDFVGDAVVYIVSKGKFVGLVFNGGNHFARQIFAACAAFCPHFSKRNGCACLLASGFNGGKLGIAVGGEAVNRHHHRQPENLFHVVDVLDKVGQTALHGGDIFGV